MVVVVGNNYQEACIVDLDPKEKLTEVVDKLRLALDMQMVVGVHHVHVGEVADRMQHVRIEVVADRMHRVRIEEVVEKNRRVLELLVEHVDDGHHGDGDPYYDVD
jgi:hypothetical protein